jgi:peroxiredoxin
MRPSRQLLAVCLIVASAWHLSTARSAAADTPAADEAWKRVDAAMTAASKSSRSTEEGARGELQEYDRLATEFLALYPDDPRRWNVLFFDGVNAEARAKAGMRARGDPAAIMEEILKAADASADVKADASAVRLLASHRTLEEGGDSTGWIKMAEEHLRASPVHPANQRIRASLEQVTTMAALGGKPLNFKFTAMDGREVDLSKLRGKVVLVTFWATWCEVCAGHMPEVAKIYEKFRTKGFEVIGISLDRDQSELERFMAAHDMPWPQHFDGKEWDGALVTSLGVNYLPTMWLINRKGLLVSTRADSRTEDLVRKYLTE